MCKCNSSVDIITVCNARNELYVFMLINQAITLGTDVKQGDHSNIPYKRWCSSFRLKVHMLQHNSYNVHTSCVGLTMTKILSQLKMLALESWSG